MGIQTGSSVRRACREPPRNTSFVMCPSKHTRYESDEKGVRVPHSFLFSFFLLLLLLLLVFLPGDDSPLNLGATANAQSKSPGVKNWPERRSTFAGNLSLQMESCKFGVLQLSSLRCMSKQFLIYLTPSFKAGPTLKNNVLSSL